MGFIENFKEKIHNLSILWFSIDLFFVSALRETKSYIFEFFFLVIFLSQYFFLLEVKIDFKIKLGAILFFDFYVKLFFLKGIISNIKVLLFAPIGRKIKKIIFFLNPIFSLLNLSIIISLCYTEFFLAFLIILNSYTVYELKITKKRIPYFILIYAILAIGRIYCSQYLPFISGCIGIGLFLFFYLYTDRILKLN